MKMLAGRRMEMKQRIEKITVSLPTDTLKLADDYYIKFGHSNRSELINTAIRKYVLEDMIRQYSVELVQLYHTLEESEIGKMEEHLSKLSYKIAVELAQINLFLTSAFELNYDDISRLRGKAVQLVNKNHGYIPLTKADRNRVELNPFSNMGEESETFD